MATHYEVLGIAPGASAAEVRRAYHDRARALHPDRNRTGDVAASERAMQDVNEAWRVLGDATRRAAYDRQLAGGVPGPVGAGGPRRGGGADPDEPFIGRPAEPADVGLSIVRAAPWAVVLFVLTVIFVFTAFAGGGNEERDDQLPTASELVGRCVQAQPGTRLVVVPCVGPNEGRVDLVANRASNCPSDTSARPYDGDGPWLCLRPAHEP